MTAGRGPLAAPRAAMVFAAGLGLRMGPLTAGRPKPLIPVGGRALIDRALDLAHEAGAAPVAVNVHYLAPMLRAHLAGGPVRIADESARLLETGGGLKAALPLLGPEALRGGPVWTLNSDAVWRGLNPLAALAAAWDGTRMEALLLLVPRARATGYRGAGDFDMDEAGRLRRGTGFVYTGAQVVRTAGLAGIPEAVFSLNRLWDAAEARGGLYGRPYGGAWCDVGRPDALAAAEALVLEGLEAAHADGG